MSSYVLSEAVENAYHALAIDDERKTFHPELWDHETLEYQSLTQVWFSGMHTDVGGGYPERGLSDIPLVWLVDKAIDNGLRIYPGHRLNIKPDPLARMHDSRGKWFLKLYKRQVRLWPADTCELPVVHESVIERASASPLPPGDKQHRVGFWRGNTPSRNGTNTRPGIGTTPHEFSRATHIWWSPVAGSAELNREFIVRMAWSLEPESRGRLPRAEHRSTPVWRRG